MNIQTAGSCPSDLTAFVADHFQERAIRPDEQIARSWFRSVIQHRLDPHGPAERHVLTASELREHQQLHQDYLAIASQGVTGLARRVMPAGFAVLLSDEHGVTLDTRLPQQRDAYDQAGLIVGACWDESTVGTNGIGTALASRQAMTIHHQEHFLVSNFRLSCSVAPIYDAQNLLRGCLNATCLNSAGPKQAQYLTLQLVLMYARMIENASFRQRYCDRLTLSIKSQDDISDLANEQLLALDEQGRIIGANHAAFVAYQHEGRLNLLNCRIDQLLPANVDELLSLSNGGARSVHLHTSPADAPVGISLHIPAAKAVPAAPRPRSTPSVKHPDLKHLAGQDPHLQEGVRRLRKVLNKDIPILITGETGTGKEAFAMAIHQASARNSGPFVALNCAAIPESLIESELFGYRGGSFTGANKKGMKGKLELANSGTLFLDEIGDMPANLQTRLLRVLAEREIFPLGASSPVPLDVQVISATHQDLASMIRDKLFREDLFYRLNGMSLALPSLRQRSDRDILINNLLSGCDLLYLTDRARKRLHDYSWPGNIRQLLNCLRYAAALAENGCADIDCLPTELQQATVPQPQSQQLSHRPNARLDKNEEQYLLETLREHRWNISAVAKVMGIARSTLYRKMNKQGIVQPNELF